MLKQYNEEYFAKIKEAARERLRPDSVSVFIIATLVFSAVMIAVSLNAVLYGDNTDSEWMIYLIVDIVLWAFHLLAALLFYNEKLAYKYQKIQAYILCFISLKFSLEIYLVYFLMCEDRGAEPFMTSLGLLMLLGGILFLVLSTWRAVHRVKKGHLRRGEKGLYNFGGSKSYISFPVIYLGAVIAGFVPRMFADSSSYTSSEPVIALVLSVLIQYLTAMFLPEFILLAYCKGRFQSFHIQPPNQRKSKQQKPRGGHKA
ncbi:hypothetical protein NST99_01000 [Paenibacillus sp. FSL L8-0470]|uniref:hypothetical protein n=1 Tax=Paenibacillus sp. FSL L8-0470 TaxID=2954688 RepID=UPI0030F724C4